MNNFKEIYGPLIQGKRITRKMWVYNYIEGNCDEIKWFKLLDNDSFESNIKRFNYNDVIKEDDLIVYKDPILKPNQMKTIKAIVDAFEYVDKKQSLVIRRNNEIMIILKTYDANIFVSVKIHDNYEHKKHFEELEYGKEYTLEDLCIY